MGLANIEEYIAKIENVKTNLKTAIEQKGGSVGDNKFENYPSAVSNLGAEGKYDYLFKDDENNPFNTKDYLTFDDIPEETEACGLPLYCCYQLKKPTNLKKIKSDIKKMYSMYSFCFVESGVNELQYINLPQLIYLNDYCMYFRTEELATQYINGLQSLTSINLPSLVSAKNNFMYFLYTSFSSVYNTYIDLPKLTSVGSRCFYFGKLNIGRLNSLDLPSLTSVGDYCFYFSSVYHIPSDSTWFKEINVPNLASVGDYCFYFASSTLPVLKKIALPMLVSAPNYLMYFYSSKLPQLTTIDLPLVNSYTGTYFLYWYGTSPTALRTINIPKLTYYLAEGTKYFLYFSSCNPTALKLIHTTGQINPYKDNSYFKTIVVSEFSSQITATNMFYYAANIVINKTTPPTLSSTMFRSVTKLYVPLESIEEYKTKTNYVTYASKMIGFKNMDMDLDTGLVTLTLSDDTTVVINA